MKTETWSSQATFLYATIGCSVGLGNLWRFPYIAGQNGGGAFVLVYIGFVLLVGIPLVMAELAIARRGHGSPVASVTAVARDESRSRGWRLIGWMSVLAPLLGLSFYSVVGGWSLDYLVQAGSGAFSQINGEQAGELFSGMLNSPNRMILSFSLMIASVTLVVGMGLSNGIERVTKVMMPLLAVLLVALAIYANIVGNSARAWSFLFSPDFSQLTADSILIALGQALFSIAVGTGALLAYGAYLPADVSIPRAAWAIGLADTAAALFAALLIFPIVFAAGLDAGEGPGLIFVTLPVAFASMPGAQIVGPLFFLLIFTAAFTSGLGMMEPFVSWAEERRWLSRPWAAIVTAVAVWPLGLAAVFSFNRWKDFTPLDAVPQLAGKTVFSILDYGVSNLVLPLNALLIALFAGWAILGSRMREDIGIESELGWRLWRLSTQFIAPIAICAVFFLNFAA
ncbi:MAG: NSS family neurotransmitter:Na+ symporter [Halieaceae bacterium]